MKRIFIILGLFITILNYGQGEESYDYVDVKKELTVRDTTISDLIDAHTAGTSVDGANGLDKVGNNIELGTNPLNKNTSILGAGYDFNLGTVASKLGTFDLNSSGDATFSGDANAVFIYGGVTWTFDGDRFISGAGDTIALISDIGAEIAASAPYLPFNFGYIYSTTITDSRPGVGYFRLNNATYSNVTFIYVDFYDVNSVNKSNYLSLPDTGSYISITDGTNYVNYQLTGAKTLAGSYYKYGVTYKNHSGVLSGSCRISLDLSNNVGGGGSAPSDSLWVDATADTLRTKVIYFDTIDDGQENIKGALYYDTTFQCLSLMNGNNSSTQLGQELNFYVKNQSGVDINDGDPVYIIPHNSDEIRVGLASNLSAITSYTSIGLATTDIPNGSMGRACFLGLAHDLNTSAFSEGNYAFMGDGVTQNTKPATGHIIVLGLVLRSSATEGVIAVNPTFLSSTIGYSALNQAGTSGTYIDSLSVETSYVSTDSLDIDGVTAVGFTYSPDFDTVSADVVIARKEVSDTNDTKLLLLKEDDGTNASYLDSTGYYMERDGKLINLFSSYYDENSITLQTDVSATNSSYINIGQTGTIQFNATDGDLSSYLNIDRGFFDLGNYYIDEFSLISSTYGSGLELTSGTSSTTYNRIELLPTAIRFRTYTSIYATINTSGIFSINTTSTEKAITDTVIVGVDTITKGYYYFSASFSDSSEVITMTQDVPAQITGNGNSLFTEYINSKGFVFQGDSVQIPVSGIGQIKYDFGFSGTNTDRYKSKIYINNVELANRGQSDRSMSANLIGSISAHTGYEFTAGDWVKIMFVNVVNNNDPTIITGNFSVEIFK